MPSTMMSILANSLLALAPAPETVISYSLMHFGGRVPLLARKPTHRLRVHHQKVGNFLCPFMVRLARHACQGYVKVRPAFYVACPAAIAFVRGSSVCYTSSRFL
jgi:hypothetical protein